MPRLSAFRNDSAKRIDFSSKSRFFLSAPRESARILIVSDMRMFGEALELRLSQHNE